MYPVATFGVHFYGILTVKSSVNNSVEKTGLNVKPIKGAVLMLSTESNGCESDRIFLSDKKTTIGFTSVESLGVQPICT